MKTKILLIFTVLAIAVLACDLPFGSNAAETVSPVESSDPVESTAVDSKLLFEDDFSDSDSGWDINTIDNGSTDYEQSGYRIFVNAENWSLWANPSRNFTDVSVSVQASKIAGDDDNEFGIICRYANADNFYLATISSDGFYGFLARIDGEALQLINMESMLQSDVINQGKELNTIRLDCIGQTLSLYVNGQFVDETFDDSIGSGDVGLYAGTFSIPGTDILFDNFAVRAP